jgi:hypothetical protein
MSLSNNDKYNLVLCELFNEHIHGFTNESDPNIHGHYMIIHTQEKVIDLDGSTDTEYESDDDDDTDSYVDLDEEIDIEDILSLNVEKYQFLRNNTNVLNNPHPLIRNYRNIASRENYIKLEIAQRIYLSGNESVAILKTFWLRILQKTWKKTFKRRKEVLNKRMHPNALFYREVHGKWPTECNYMPGLRSMLSRLSK